MKEFVSLAKPVPGDVVGVVSPSAGLPGLFPWVQELGLQRLRDEFGLVPLEYPTTRQMGASYQERARDVMAAFADPAVKVVFSSIGGQDEIGLIRYLDPEVLRANPKPYFGYSDNTNLHNLLWELGIPSFYGGSTLVQLAQGGGMHALTRESLRHALFDHGEYEMGVSDEFTEGGLDWADRDNLHRVRPMQPNDGWFWDGQGDVEGLLWGGCCEVLLGIMVAGQHVPRDEDLDGAVFYMETSEEMPVPFTVGYLMTAFGERGWLDRFSAILVGRPKAWYFDRPLSQAEGAQFRAAQRDAVLSAVRAYNPTIPVVQNLDFGHTDPQVIVPSGQRARVLSSSRRILLTY